MDNNKPSSRKPNASNDLFKKKQSTPLSDFIYRLIWDTSANQPVTQPQKNPAPYDPPSWIASKETNPVDPEHNSSQMTPRAQQAEIHQDNRMPSSISTQRSDNGQYKPSTSYPREERMASSSQFAYDERRAPYKPSPKPPATSSLDSLLRAAEQRQKALQPKTQSRPYQKDHGWEK